MHRSKKRTAKKRIVLCFIEVAAGKLNTNTADIAIP